MSGERDLQRLLASMKPSLRPETFVFATLPQGTPVPTSMRPVMIFEESEGSTLILDQDAATGLSATFPCRMITLEIHSSLEAVGFLAAITARLAASGIPVNAVSAFHHDHLFVPAARAEEAMGLLEALTGEAATGGADEDDTPGR